MHHLLHDLARSVSGIFCSIDDSAISFPKEARHSLIFPKDTRATINLRSSLEPRALRTLLVLNRLRNPYIRQYHYTPDSDLLPISLSANVFQNLQFLRTLDLSYTNLDALPDSISMLKFLRFLGLNRTKVRVLTESLCSLYNLQTLELQYCYDLQDLPECFSWLSNLRHLLLPTVLKTVQLPLGIKKLTNLQTLSVFHVGRESTHYVIRELEYLVNLRAELIISGLCNIVNADDAKAGNLRGKEHLDKLTLEWSGSYSDPNSVSLDRVLWEQERPVLGAALHTIGLQHDVGEDLSISGSSNDKAESHDDDQWIFNIDVVYEPVDLKKAKVEVALRKRQLLELQEKVFDCLQPHANLKELIIQRYQGSRFPRWMGDRYLTKLESVTLHECGGIEALPPLGQLPSLKHLHMESLDNLKHVDRQLCGHGNEIYKAFPALEELEFEKMYKWEQWSGVEDGDFPRLRRLQIANCWKLRILPSLAFLRELELDACDRLTSLPIMPLLMSLNISYCHGKILSSLSQEFSMLRTLTISSMPIVTSLSLQHLFSLRTLNIHYCHQRIDSLAQQELPTVYVELPPKLRVLNISRCNTLCFSPDEEMTSTLEVLTIYDCPFLAEWCQNHGNRLSHVSQVMLDHREF